MVKLDQSQSKSLDSRGSFGILWDFPIFCVTRDEIDTTRWNGKIVRCYNIIANIVTLLVYLSKATKQLKT